MHIIFLFERCDKCPDVIKKLLAFPTIILQLVYWVLKRTYERHNRTEWSHFTPLEIRLQMEGGGEESWNSQSSSSSYHDNGYSRIIDIRVTVMQCQTYSQTRSTDIVM